MHFLHKYLVQLQNDSSLRWGFRLALCVTLPLLYGHFWQQQEDAFWMAIAAQSVSLIEYRGSFSLRFRVLIGAIFFVVFFGVLGMIVGNYPYVHLLMMFVVGMLSALFKNLGERGIGMSLSIFILFIISGAYPSLDYLEIMSRSVYLGAGGMLVFLVVIVGTLFQKKNKPFYHFMAQLYSETKTLIDLQKKGWAGEGKFSSLHSIYIQESKVREIINTFLNFYAQTIDSISSGQKTDYNLASQRKTLVIIYNVILSINEQIIRLRSHKYDNKVDTTVHTVLNHLSIICHLGTRYYRLQQAEDYHLWQSRIAKLQKLHAQLQTSDWESALVADAMMKINVNINRVTLLTQKLLILINDIKPNPYYRYTSFSSIISILHPGKFGNEFANLLRYEPATLYHSLRVGLAAMIGLFIAQQYFIDHGYWIPFTAIIVAQPYASATLRRGIQRSVGTILGIFIGYLLILLPHPFYWNFVAIFISALCSIYFIKRNYSITSMFMTLVVVGLLSLKPPLDFSILSSRIISTIIGSSIIIFLNYLLFRRNEKENINDLMIKTLMNNYLYFIHGINSLQQQDNKWMTYKKNAENSNVNFFDAYNRYRVLVGKKSHQQRLPQYFSIITHLFRCTKETTEFFIAQEMLSAKRLQHIPIDNYYYEIKNTYLEIFQILGVTDISRQSIASYTFDKSHTHHLEKIILELKQVKTDLA